MRIYMGKVVVQIKITKNDVKSFFEHRYKLGILEDFLQRPNLNPSGKMIFNVFNTLYIYKVLLLEAWKFIARLN